LTSHLLHYVEVVSQSPVPRRLRTPGWFDLRLLFGLFLVLGSVAGGALVVTRADSTKPMLSVTRDLSIGTVLTSADVRTSRVRLGADDQNYLSASTDVVGQALQRPLSAGELLPRSALGGPDRDDTALTIPVQPQNAPEVRRGQRVTIWVSTAYCQAIPVLTDVTIQDVRAAGSGALSASSQESLVVRVSSELALRVVIALGLDAATIRVGVLTGSPGTRIEGPLPALTRCQPPVRSS
jgi:hypothetical protein